MQVGKKNVCHPSIRLSGVFAFLCFVLTAGILLGIPTEKAEAITLSAGEVSADGFQASLQGDHNIVTSAAGVYENNKATITLTNETDGAGVPLSFSRTGGWGDDWLVVNGNEYEGLDRTIILIYIPQLKKDCTYTLKVDGDLKYNNGMAVHWTSEIVFSIDPGSSDNFNPDPNLEENPPNPLNNNGGGGSGGGDGSSQTGTGSDDGGAYGDDPDGADGVSPTDALVDSTLAGGRLAAGAGGGYWYAVGLGDTGVGTGSPEEPSAALETLSGAGETLSISILVACALLGVVSGIVTWRRQTKATSFPGNENTRRETTTHTLWDEVYR